MHSSLAATLRRVASLFGVAAGVLAIAFALAQLAGFGGLVAPILGALVMVWGVALAVAALAGGLALQIEGVAALQVPPPRTLPDLFAPFPQQARAPSAPPPRLRFA